MLEKALIMLENGFHLHCKSFAGAGEYYGEFVFNTAMTGYEEIITDPSYKGQIVTFTYPLIGNYGVTRSNLQSDEIHCEAVVIREISSLASNFESRETLKEFLESHGKIGVCDCDTRALTTQIRTKGAMRGAISTVDLNPESLLKKVLHSADISEVDLYKAVINKEVVTYEATGDKDITVLAVDFGIKQSIIKNLMHYFGKIHLVPFDENFEQNIKQIEFDAVFLSNGPGDPRRVQDFDKYILSFVENKIPLTAICFGHQLIGKAYNLDIIKLPFGHHGGNHPVKNLADGKVYITSQNHNYAISMNGLEQNTDFELTWLHLYDNTVSGIKHKHLPLASVQFHPEAAPGPNEASRVVFNDFYNLIKNKIKNNNG